MQATQKEQEADGANNEMPSLDLLQVQHSEGAGMGLTGSSVIITEVHADSTMPTWVRWMPAALLHLHCSSLLGSESVRPS